MHINGSEIHMESDIESYSMFLLLTLGQVCSENLTTIVEHIGVKKGDIFIDLGANLGQEIEPMAGLDMEVHAFEPHPLLFSFLESRYDSNENVILHKAAMSSINEEANFYFKGGPLEINGGATLAEGKNDALAGATVVKCIDIAEYIHSLGRQVRILKIDVEGFEYVLLARLVNKDLFDKIDYILLEDHGGDGSPRWREDAVKVIACMNARLGTTKIILWNGSDKENTAKFLKLFSEFQHTGEPELSSKANPPPASPSIPLPELFLESPFHINSSEMNDDER